MIRKTHAEKPNPRYIQRGENIFKKEGLTLLQIHTSVFVTVNVNSVKQLTQSRAHAREKPVTFSVKWALHALHPSQKDVTQM